MSAGVTTTQVIPIAKFELVLIIIIHAVYKEVTLTMS